MAPFLPTVRLAHFVGSFLPQTLAQTPGSSMIDDLTVDELRWLEASEIIDFPASPTDSFHVNERVVLSQRTSRFTEDFHQPGSSPKTPATIASSSTSSASARESCSSKRSTSISSSPPVPIRTPLHRGNPSQSSFQSSSPSEWLYRRPKNPIASRVGPSTSALSSTMPPSQSAPVREVSPLLIRTSSVTSAKAGKANSDNVGDTLEEPVAKASANAPLWSNMLRPRSRSVRSIPALKPIPSQSQVDILHNNSPPLSHHRFRSEMMDDIPESITIGRRSPSISSTSSSTLSSAASSSHPDTPVSAHPDPFGAFVTKAHKGHHRRHISAPTNPRDSRVQPPLSTPSPSKSILTRSSSISTKYSAITSSNKSVKFVEVPTVHYSSAGYWGDVDGTDRRTQAELRVDDMGMDVDSMDMGSHPPSRVGGGAWNMNRLGFAGPQWSNTTEFDMDVDPPPRVPQQGKNNSSGLKRLMSLSRRSSVSSAASSSRRKSSASTSSTITITPSKPLPPTPSSHGGKAQQLPPTPSKPAISGPYALGSVQAVSPTHSTASLRSTSRHKPKAKSTSYIPTPGSSGSSSVDDYDLEDCRSTGNGAARSVRSVASIRSDASASTTKRFKSFLLHKVGVGGAWSKN